MAASGLRNVAHRLAVFTLFTVILTAAGTSSRTQANIGDNRKLPLLRPLRRVVRNFVNERQAFITIVFQRSDVMPKMRWFREANSLPNAEIPNMINIDGDSRYRVRMISSNDITAVTLTIQPLEVTSFPVKFVTCFSYEDDPFQYQLDTIVEEQTYEPRPKPQVLDGIIWLHAPPPNVTFTPELTIHCAVKLENESSRFTDELNAYRTYVDRKRFKNNTYSGPHLMSAGCGKMHKDRENYAEAQEGSKYIFQGRRYEPVPGLHGQVVYDVSFKVLNGSQEDVGVYTCAGERARDRTYISSWVNPSQSIPPVMLFLPCEDNVAVPSVNTASPHHTMSYQVRVIEDRPTCVRCRVYDRRMTKIHLTRNGEPFRRSDQSLQLDEHLNVADGGLSELTLTWLSPDSTAAGRYRCTAHHMPDVYVEFTVVTRNAGRSRPQA